MVVYELRIEITQRKKEMDGSNVANIDADFINFDILIIFETEY